MISFANLANSELVIKIDKSTVSSIPIIIHMVGDTEDFSSSAIKNIIKSDLYGSGYFKILDEKNIENDLKNLSTQYSLWKFAGANYVFKGSITKDNTSSKITFDLYDISKKTKISSYKIPLKNNHNVRKVSHTISNVLFELITGIEGVFDTKIAYISSEDLLTRERYKLYVADIDGFNPVAIFTSNRQLMSPAWSPDNKHIAYVSFENRRPQIFIQTLSTGKRKKLFGGKVSSSAPAWSPDGKKLAYTTAVKGNLEIFIYDLDSGSSTRFTNSIGIDTEADWHPNGKQIIFTSDRSGKPNIYIKSVNNKKKAKRLTFKGNYSADANISNDHNYITYVNNLGNGYQIAVMDIKRKYTHTISRGVLDEAPSFAPNGKMILYATKKKKKGILVATSSDGRIRKEIQIVGEDVREPVWSNK
ncbi:MAG: Tol-Pal system beta propeller repeat protein TolB [Pseudomonadota bacterium]|nr:Tol-Pal system beta propeller repeat protein TolB [Pseudomonadota bacterium]|tara:strand:+ start:15 stop:1265 length:1251 start_codon:yes stop_codon:yes gene_type:complete